PLAGGLPMGAVIVSERVAATLEAGDHATTFGGGPLVSSVALAVTRTIADPAFLARVEALGAHLEARLATLAARVPGVRGVRGLGLMRGILLDGPAAPVVARARELGLLVVSAGPDVVRLVPPLTITEPELDQGVDLLARALGAS
ncbi:MAG TPA: aminotransferase class III-fold pyridoxal phosphate-dependent enzyme, partial [Longimicrobiales bacterium]|nr:aminotransferase class III-fold pyridoxal phosphate-dependent enzyme [Longimicrobiales bacterium]